MKNIGTVGAVVITVVVMLVVSAGIRAAVNRPSEVQSTPQANSNTFRNSFMSGCLEEVKKYPSINGNYYCSCGYNKMIEMYPDFSTNTVRLNRILTEGYNSTETDAIVPCYVEK